jgi:hypothetical protein
VAFAELIDELLGSVFPGNADPAVHKLANTYRIVVAAPQPRLTGTEAKQSSV